MTTVTPIEGLRRSPAAALFEGGQDAHVSIFLTHYRRGQGPARHFHPSSRDLRCPLGNRTVHRGGEELEVPAGHVVVVPAGTTHGFKCAGDDELQVISVHPSPSVIQTDL